MIKVRNDARLAAEMAKAGLDVLLVFSMENLFYLSGALFSLQDNLRERLACAGFTRDGRDFLICATNEMSGVEARVHTSEFRGYVEFQGSAPDSVADVLGEMGLDDAMIGVEKHYLMAAHYERLAALLPKARLVGGDRALEIARAIKTPEHIPLIARANRLTEEAVFATFADTRPGESEKAMSVRLIGKMYDAGADVIRHAVLTVGDNARHAHPYPSAEKRLEAGDIIRVDVGGLFNGFGSDIARMAVVGTATPAQRKQYDILRRAQRETAAALRHGVTAGDVYQAAVDAYARAGVSGYKRDHVGHSMSILGGHDNPMLHPGSSYPLEQDMVMAVEPIFRDQEGRRYTVEDVFHVTANGAKLLTDATDTTEMFPIK